MLATILFMKSPGQGNCLHLTLSKLLLHVEPWLPRCRIGGCRVIQCRGGVRTMFSTALSRVTGSKDYGGEEEPGAEIVVQAAESRQATLSKCGILAALILPKLSAVPIFEMVAADIRASIRKNNNKRSNGITVECGIQGYGVS
jgi:hypothetical protein